MNKPITIENFISHEYDYVGLRGFGMIVKTADGQMGRQGIIYDPRGPAEDMVRALGKLLKFLQEPDERLRVGTDLLCGAELNIEDFPTLSEALKKEEAIWKEKLAKGVLRKWDPTESVEKTP